MFKDPFSFNGRIRRLEYGLSYIIYIVTIIVIQVLLVAIVGDSASEDMEGVGGLILLILLVPVCWFLIAQNTKRCHDLGNSGWWQLIPFYGLWLFFADGDAGPNRYGENPKGVLSLNQIFTTNQPDASGNDIL